MLRILVAAAYFYMNQDGEDSRPLETQQQALEKAKEVEKTVQDQADALKKQIDEQTANDDGQP